MRQKEDFLKFAPTKKYSKIKWNYFDEIRKWRFSIFVIVNVKLFNRICFDSFPNTSFKLFRQEERKVREKKELNRIILLN